MSSDHQNPAGPRKPAWWQLWRKFKERRLGSTSAHGMSTSHSQSSIQDWLDALDKLQPLVRNMRNEIDDLDGSQLSFDVLGAGTFLLQVDLLLIKLRQHFNNYQRRVHELNLDIPQIKLTLDRAALQSQACFKSLMNLYAVLNTKTYNQLNHPSVIQEVQRLETATKGLTDCMNHLNEMALKRDPVYQLFENELFKTLLEIEQGHSLGLGESSGPSTTGPMRDKAHHIIDSDLRKIAFNIISYYDTLKRCSVLYHSHQVASSLETFKHHVDVYLDTASNQEKNVQYMAEQLHGLFFALEAMRFIRFKGFQEKAKSIKKQLTSLLKTCAFGRECLKSLQMSPRSKLTLKSRFPS